MRSEINYEKTRLNFRVNQQKENTLCANKKRDSEN